MITPVLDYWVRRRVGLSEREWSDFFLLVTHLLMRTRLGPEYGDPAMRRDLIQTFFSEKIFANARTSEAGALENVHALHGYLKNFTRDIARRENAYMPLPDDQDLGGHGDGSECDDGSSVDQDLGLGQRLREVGIDPGEAAASADDFVASLDPLDFTYLSEHACADDDAREPVSSIAARLRASSYHYRAKQLGITRSKGETFAGYEQTKIGRWMRSLGAVLAPDWQEGDQNPVDHVVRACLKHGRETGMSTHLYPPLRIIRAGYAEGAVDAVPESDPDAVELSLAGGMDTPWTSSRHRRPDPASGGGRPGIRHRGVGRRPDPCASQDTR